jgi:hypothetical protein
VAIRVVPDEVAAGLEAPAAAAVVGAGGVAELELDELAHAATASTPAARATAVTIFRIGRFLLTPC